MTYKVRNLGIAIVLAIVAALFTVTYVSSYKRNVQRGQQTVPVVVAAKDIPVGMSGTEIVQGHFLSTSQVTRKTVVPGAISDPSQIQSLVATQPVFAGEQVTARHFGPAAEQGVRTQLTGSLRAVQIAGDQNQLLAGTLKPGDRIDVLASLKYKVSDVVQGGAGSAADVDRVATRIVLRNLKVLDVSGASGATAKLTSGPNPTYWVILAVSDNQAQKLFFVVKNGDWSLELRPVLHAADSPSGVETVESVLGDGLRLAQFSQLYAGKAPH